MAIDLSQSLESRRERLHEKIADRLQAMICERDLEPGAHLPPLRELAKQMNTSRTTVGEAVRLLEQRGLTQVKIGSGTYVTNQTRSVFVDSLARLFTSGNCSYEDLMAFREMIEPDVVALAAERASPRDAGQIGECLERVEEAWHAGDVDTIVSAEAGFHEALAGATHNELVIAICVGIQHVLRWTLRDRYSASLDEKGLFSHRPIFDAVVAADPEGARAAMAEHVRLSGVAS